MCAFYQASAKPNYENEKYFLFFKTWNFLKYYHAEFAGGKEDADSFFLKKQILLDKISNKAALNTFLMSMVNNLGVSDANEAHLENNDLRILKANPLHAWYLNNVLISAELKRKLLSIYRHRDTIGKHYIPALHYTTEVPNERKYEYLDSANLPLDMRLLALAKLQGVIDYLYPHKSLMNQKWEETIKNNIPLFKSCASRMDYELLLLKIVAKLNDTHAFNRFFDHLVYKKEIFKNRYYPPFAYRIIDNMILVTEIIVPGLCAEAGIKVGDLITAINEQSISRRIDGLSQLLSASNRNTLIFKVNNYITNFIWSSDSSHFRLEVSSSGEKKNICVQFIVPENKDGLKIINNYLNAKSEIKAATLPFQVIDNEIAYFNIDKIDKLLNDVKDDQIDARIDSILNLAAQQKGMIFDMRGYPRWGGFVYHYIYKKFSKFGNQFGQYFHADVKDVGSFTSIPGTATYYPSRVKTEGFDYKGKVCIIVNAQTQSLSEWSTMNLQHIFPKSITIGEQTAGADGDEKHVNLPGNYTIYFTGNAIYYPDGTLAQGKGLKINKIVKPQIEDILSGKDTQLQFAIGIVKFGRVASRKGNEDSVATYLQKSLEIMKARSVNSKDLNWNEIFRQANTSAKGAKTLRATYPFIKEVINRLGDSHSKFFEPEVVEAYAKGYRATGQKFPEIKAMLLENSSAYIALPGFYSYNMNEWDEFVNSFRIQLSRLKKLNPSGWILDLRGNEGGMFAPMYAAIAPLLDQSCVIGWKDGWGKNNFFCMRGNKFFENKKLIHRFKLLVSTGKIKSSKIAVLINNKTASSGEFAAISFVGQKNVAFIGTKTNGLTSANQEHKLSDGAFLVLTEGVTIDRNSKPYAKIGKGLDADVKVSDIKGSDQMYIEKAYQYISSSWQD